MFTGGAARHPLWFRDKNIQMYLKNKGCSDNIAFFSVCKQSERINKPFIGVTNIWKFIYNFQWKMTKSNFM